MRGVSGGRASGELCRTAQGKSALRRLDMSGTRCKLVEAEDLLADALERRSKHLLPLVGMFGGPGECRPTSVALAPRLPLLCARERAFLVAQVAKPLQQRFQIVDARIVNGRMVGACDNRILLVTEEATLGFAGNGHRFLQRACACCGSASL